jgi:hypothetical protein
MHKHSVTWIFAGVCLLCSLWYLWQRDYARACYFACGAGINSSVIFMK